MNFKSLLVKAILALVILFKALSLFSQPVLKNAESRFYLDFYILESEFSEGKYITGNLYDLNFNKYSGDIIKSAKKNLESNLNRMLTLRAEFIIDSSNLNKDLYLVALPIDYACNIYLNGKIISKRGNIINGYTNRIHYSNNILLHPDLILYNSINNLAFQLYPKDGGQYPIGKVFITNANDAANYTFLRNLLGPKLILALSFCGIIFSIFFFFTYISRREYQKLHFLYFAFMNLFFVISYINNIISFDFANTYLLEKIARTGFPVFIFVGICFLVDYTNLFKRKNLFKLSMALIYLPALLMILRGKTTTELISIYNSYPLISLVLGDAVLLVLSFLFFRREKDLSSFFLFLVMVLNLFAGFYDGYYFAVLRIKPYVLLTPNTVFLINFVIFIILLIDHSKLYHLVIKNSEELKSLNENLEIKVDERTKKIVEYTTELEIANNTKDKFFSIIAHDLKNPFNSLIGYSEILKNEFREMITNEVQELIKILNSTSKQGYSLLENLLHWAQSQTNQIEVVPSKINLLQLSKQCIDSLESQSQFKDIEIINKINTTIEIVADENLLKTIFRNLISNAIKYTPRNGLVIVKAENVNNKIEISIKDTGIGISEKEKQEIFRIDKLYSKPGTNNEKGSGLGLILCKEFVERLGGNIWVESQEGYGSEFKFTLTSFK